MLDELSPRIRRDSMARHSSDGARGVARIKNAKVTLQGRQNDHRIM